VVNSSSNLLITAVTEEAAAKDFSRFFDASVARGIRSSKQALEAGKGERRTAAIINIDIRGFSTLAANRAPSEVMQILSRYQGRLVPVLKQHGAIIDKFMGDGIMATIGLDDPAITHARNAVEAVEAILADHEKWGEEEPFLCQAGVREIGIGVAAGEVSFGAVGQENRLEMTVIGAPVNMSAKLEKHNKALGSKCIVSRTVWNRALEEGYDGNLQPQLIEQDIEGIGANQEIAVIGATQLPTTAVTSSRPAGT
jgi:adenylate cyclase